MNFWYLDFLTFPRIYGCSCPVDDFKFNFSIQRTLKKLTAPFFVNSCDHLLCIKFPFIIVCNSLFRSRSTSCFQHSTSVSLSLWGIPQKYTLLLKPVKMRWKIFLENLRKSSKAIPVKFFLPFFSHD